MKNRTTTFRRWILPTALLTAASLCIFFGLYAVDLATSRRGVGIVASYSDFDAVVISDALSSLAGMTAAVFGIVVTVVSIIVQLSADRYTGVARMFLKDRVNLAVMSYYLIACVGGVWLSMSLKHDWAPRVTALAMVCATTASLVLVGPYFGYVFWFLEPMNIISRIRSGAVKTSKRGSREQKEDACADAQADTLFAMEELTDITSNSISGKDKIIASGAVDALKDFALDYQKSKARASEAWFRIGPSIRENPDFVAMDPESLHDLERRRTWVEWKVMRQYLGIYNESLAEMRDITYLVAIDTRYIGEAAAQAGDSELVELVFRFMNSYLRSTLNARDVRTAYNVLNQYRLLVEAMLRLGHGKTALEGVRHMTYYGHVSYDMKLTFVTETVAYDVSALCQAACEQSSPEEQQMLSQFLELDRPLRTSAQESALLGVRKAQVKLAAYYLVKGHEAKAKLISRDMEHEPPARLLSIRQALESVTSKDFWEIIDRGRNFEYMPPGQRASLATFFGWLNVDASAAPEVSATSAASNPR